MAFPNKLIKVIDGGGPPDLAMHFDLCLSSLDSLLGGKSAAELLEQRITTAMTNAQKTLAAQEATAPLADLFATPPDTVEVLSLCPARSEQERIGMWLLHSRLVLISEARRNSLATIDLLPPGRKVGIQFRRETIQLFIEEIWARLTSQSNRINERGQPDAKGPIVLRSWQINSPAPDRVVLTVVGTYLWEHYGIGLGVDFTLTSTELLRVIGVGHSSFVRCDVSQQLDVNLIQVHAAQAYLFFIAGFFGPLGIPAHAFAQSTIESAVRNGLARNAPALQIACLISSFLPSQIPLPGTQLKLVFSYDEIRASFGYNGEGLLAYSKNLPRLEVRTPVLIISGPRSLRINRALDKRKAITVHYRLLPGDMLLPAQVLAWTGDPDVSSPDQLETDVVFDISDAEIGDVVVFKLLATMTDADGLKAKARATIEIVITHDRPHPPPPPPPPPVILDE